MPASSRSTADRGSTCTASSIGGPKPDVEATTRHKQAEGSGYWRHFHFGLLTHEGTPKPVLDEYDPSLGICQWFHFEAYDDVDRTLDVLHERYESDHLLILGDFNRRLSGQDEFYLELDDSEPEGADLELATAGHTRRISAGDAGADP